VLPPRFRRPRYLVVAIVAVLALCAVPATIYFKSRPEPTPIALS